MTHNADWSHRRERFSSDQCCDGGSDSEMDHEEKISKTWQLGGQAPGSQRVGANELEASQPCSSLRSD